MSRRSGKKPNKRGGNKPNNKKKGRGGRNNPKGSASRQLTIEQKLSKFYTTEKGVDDETNPLRITLPADNFPADCVLRHEDDEETEGEGGEIKEVQQPSAIDWYSLSTKHWEDQSSDINGMLGGYDNVSEIDANGSIAFARLFLQGKGVTKIKRGRTIDCGAGIGRVAKLVLSKLGFEHLDLLEQNQTFLDYAKNTHLKGIKCIDNFICDPLQTAKLEEKSYDLIWIQWVIIYLTDRDLISFLKMCKTALSDTGIIILKDNVHRSHFILDTQDASVTRSDRHLKLIFEAAGLRLVKEKLQTDFPKELLLVRMFALQ